MSDTQLVEYCRIEDGKIVEYPVYEIHIRNRAHPFEMYTPVTVLIKPTLPPFSYYSTKLELSTNGVPVLQYVVNDKTVDMVLAELYQFKGGIPSPMGLEAQDIFLDEVDPLIVGYVYKKAQSFAQDYLDNWTLEREYSGIVSLVGYVSSKNASRAIEGQNGVYMRDKVWDAFYAYFDKLKAGTQAVPRTMAEIAAQLPALQWPEVVTPT